MRALIRDGKCIAINSIGFGNIKKENGDLTIEHDNPVIDFNYDDSANLFYKQVTPFELSEQAKITLATALSADIESGGYTWQVRNSIDLANIQKVIDQNDRANYPSGTTQSFRMADNTWQDLTIDHFHQVLSDEAVRTRAIYDAYRTWTEGDMKEEFKV